MDYEQAYNDLIEKAQAERDRLSAIIDTTPYLSDDKSHIQWIDAAGGLRAIRAVFGYRLARGILPGVLEDEQEC